MALDDIEKRLKVLEDTEDIKKMHQSYIGCLDNLLFDKALEYFIEDCTAELCDSGVYSGIKEVTKLYHAMEIERDNVRDGHFACEPDITVDGDTAKGTWTIFIMFFKPSVQWVRGKQQCNYVKIDGKWKFKNLKFQRISASDPSLLY
jgi:hypothetical protein